jgi:hypothetical protein
MPVISPRRSENEIWERRDFLALVDGGDVATDHMCDEAVGRDIGEAAGMDGSAVAQNGDAIPDGAQLVHAVGDVNDSHAAGFQIANDAEDLLGFSVGKRGGGLIEDQQARSVLYGAADFDQLLPGWAEPTDPPGRIQRKFILFDEPAGTLEDGAPIDPAERGAFFAPEKNVFGD